jgi:hypothetical protein
MREWFAEDGLQGQQNGLGAPRVQHDQAAVSVKVRRADPRHGRGSD